jgi:hypothetical protein
VTIDFDNNEKPYTFILKIPTEAKWNEMGMEFSEAEHNHNKEYIQEMHNVECGIYGIIKDLKVSTFLKTQKKLFKDFPAPKIYCLERPSVEHLGLIMMEDLSGRGATLGLFFSANKQHCLNMARHIADFQVITIHYCPIQTK